MRERLSWVPREVALRPCAVVGLGPVARALGGRVLALGVGELRGLAWGNGLLLLGQEEGLPWVEGALYLGEDPLAPGLLTPTLERPSVPSSLVLEALGGLPPWAICRGLSLPASQARALCPEALQRWMEI